MRFAIGQPIQVQSHLRGLCQPLTNPICLVLRALGIGRIAQWHRAQFCIEYRGRDCHVRASQTYHQDQHPDRTFHGVLLTLRDSWEEASPWRDYTDKQLPVQSFLQRGGRATHEFVKAKTAGWISRSESRRNSASYSRLLP